MGYIDVAGVSLTLPDGRPLLDEASFRVGAGSTSALIGPNGAGKSTILRIIRGEQAPDAGVVTIDGSLGVMDQFVGHGREGQTVHELLIAVSPARIRATAEALEAAENALIEDDTEPTQMRYATAIAEYADAGGYEHETVWDQCTVAALGIPFERARFRDLATLSGGEQKRLALEALLLGPDDVLLLDEPDNYLDVPGKRWLEERLRETQKTVLLVSHDRELLARAADRIVTLEPGGAGATAWVHGGGFATYHQARVDRMDRLDELRRRWDEQHEKLKTLVANLKVKASANDGFASRYQAAQTRLRKFEEAGPPEERPPAQDFDMRLRGARTGKRAIVCTDLELTGLMRPFDAELWFGDRVAVLGHDRLGAGGFGATQQRGVELVGCGPVQLEQPRTFWHRPGDALHRHRGLVRQHIRHAHRGGRPGDGQIGVGVRELHDPERGEQQRTGPVDTEETHAEVAHGDVPQRTRPHLPARERGAVRGDRALGSCSACDVGERLGAERRTGRFLERARLSRHRGPGAAHARAVDVGLGAPRDPARRGRVIRSSDSTDHETSSETTSSTPAQASLHPGHGGILALGRRRRPRRVRGGLLRFGARYDRDEWRSAPQNDRMRPKAEEPDTEENSPHRRDPILEHVGIRVWGGSLRFGAQHDRDERRNAPQNGGSGAPNRRSSPQNRGSRARNPERQRRPGNYRVIVRPSGSPGPCGRRRAGSGHARAYRSVGGRCMSPKSSILTVIRPSPSGTTSTICTRSGPSASPSRTHGSASHRIPCSSSAASASSQSISPVSSRPSTSTASQSAPSGRIQPRSSPSSRRCGVQSAGIIRRA